MHLEVSSPPLQTGVLDHTSDLLSKAADHMVSSQRSLKRTGALGAVLLVAALAACTQKAPAPEPVRAVRTQVVSGDTAGRQQEFAAEIRARVEPKLGFRVGGKLVSRTAEVGQQVQAGQILARIDATDLRLSQEAAAATVRAAQTNLDLAREDLSRYTQLRDQGFIGQAEFDRRSATLKAQQAQFDQVRAQANVQGNQAGYAVLTAPAAGVVTAVLAEVGTVLAAGSTVVQLAQDGARDAVFSVPEQEAAGLRALIGQRDALQVRSWAGDRLLPATVREVSAAADAVTRTFQVKADIGQAPLLLGQTASVLLQEQGVAGVVKLPLAAVLQQQGRTSVWLLDRGSMTVQLQSIVVGGAEGNNVVVAAGLTPGQTVVTAGVHVLTPGQKVSFYAEPRAASSAAR